MAARRQSIENLVFVEFVSDKWRYEANSQASRRLLGKFRRFGMNVNDPIADFLTRLRNAQKAQQEVVSTPASMMKISIAHILREEGFIKNYKCIRDSKQGVLKVALKYDASGRGAITGIKRVSKPSLRVYLGHNKLPKIRNNYGVAILSTSKGVMTNRSARALKIGGEHICSVY